ncbi:hypothetical protein Gotur_032217, partial [Gossypium turneri]
MQSWFGDNSRQELSCARSCTHLRISVYNLVPRSSGEAASDESCKV